MNSAVSIPQAVSAVATQSSYAYEVAEVNVSIPQAVSAVATIIIDKTDKKTIKGFNTASGKRCCNMLHAHGWVRINGKVSIPQAVSAVATHH